MRQLTRNRKRIAVLLLVIYLAELISPTAAYALTGGPSQPEVQSFEPAGTEQMVEPFTGDFVYNIPLLDVGGYPVNLSYHSGISMDMEASWVGLGWNINPGVINRNVRGLPDDFSGDPIEKEYNVKKDWTAGVSLGAGIETAGFAVNGGGSMNMGVFYNNYKGVGFEGGTSFSFKMPIKGTKTDKTSGLGISLNLGISFNSQSGVDISPSSGLCLKDNSPDKNTIVGANMGLTYNSRVGLSSLTQSVNGKVGVMQGSKSMGISFVSQPVMPSIDFPMENFGFNASIKLGGTLQLTTGSLHLTGDIKGYYSQQKLKVNKQQLPGYGYMYMHSSGMDPQALLDFSREKDMPFRKPDRKTGDEGTPVMAIPSYGYDLFSVTGQGVSGQYRSMRSEIGSTFDHATNATSGSGAANIDVGIGAYASVGIDLSFNVVLSNTGQWVGGNDLFDKLAFRGFDNTLYEPAGFINSGEKVINDEEFYQAIGAEDPVRVQLTNDWFGVKTKHWFERYRYNQEKDGLPILTVKKNKRLKRNQVFSYLTAEEGKLAALQSTVQSYPFNQFPVDMCGNSEKYVTNIQRMSHSGGKRKHMTEVTVLNADGNRYVYGIPAYNRVKKEVTFSVRRNPTGNQSGVTTYDSGDNSLQNSKGMENFFSSEKMPGYSHSFLLTAVLSPDYVDLTGDGPTADDLGTSVRINYTQAYGPKKRISDGGGGLYKWRVPYERNKANYQEGFKSDSLDDKGNYVYGEKEVYFMHSIESKTMVALFKVSDREDGLGVIDENGGKLVSAKLKKLDRIELYSKSDLIHNSTNAIPIKTVHFEYSYQLCRNVENNSGAAIVAGGTDVNANHGKLTLQKVYFTYQYNRKGKLSPYVFHYDDSYNYPYHLKHQDRWGNYKLNTEAGITATEAEYPYTIQDRDFTYKYARAWSLNKITLPTGGVINIEAESDDYAYVQDKRAMQMFEIAGLGNSPNYSSSDLLYTTIVPNFNDPDKHNDFVYIKIPSNGTPLTREQIKNRYFEGIEHLYFRCAVKMYPGYLQSDDKAEYVPGYCRFDDFGACPGRSDMIWVKLTNVPLGNNGNEVVNPITKTAWQFLRTNLPFLAYPGSQTNDGSFISIIKAIIAPIFDMQNIFVGFSRACMARQWCQRIILDRSWIRLDCPDYNKLGGGSRIKSLTISDSWDNMITGEAQATYGQVYDYTMDGPNGTKISSGVAEYEPMIGQDENPHRQPLVFKQKTRLAPHSQFWIETPVAESFYPAPGVGYRQIKVSSYGSSQVSPDKGTGYTIKKFYTAYDFPVTTDYTPLLHRLHRTPSIFQILQLPMVEHFVGSQGFQIELNDMHGKPRSEEVYDNNSAIVSKTEYKYKVDNPLKAHLHLNNDVKLLMPDGSIQQGSIGKDIELMTDNRHHETMAFCGGVQLQLEISKVDPIPVPAIYVTFFPTIGMEHTLFRAFTTMKTVRRFGILESTTVQQYGSTVTTKNKVFDSETGEVVLTETQNEYEDPVFNLSYPAHLAYDGMGPAYKNIGAEFTRVEFVNGRIVSPANIEQYFTAGDEVLVSNRFNDGIKLWAIDPHHTNPEKGHQIVFIKADGKVYHNPGNTIKVKIIRSGRRNMASTPIASITSLVNPIHADTLGPIVTDNIVNVSVTEFKDEWKINCDKITTAEMDSCRKPNCSCMFNLLQFIVSNNYWTATPEDSVFINDCCLDSCFYLNGTSSNTDCGTCRRHIYAEQGQELDASEYYVHVGRCILKISRDDEYLGAWTLTRRVDSLRMLKCNDVVIMDSACTTVGNYYETTNQFPLVNIQGGQKIHYTAELQCNALAKQICVDLSPDSIINPYRYGLLGNWRPYKQWAYRGMRTPGSISSTGGTNIRTDGVYSTYDNFWVYNSTESKFMKHPSLSARYVNATTMTKYNSKGADIENRDAAGIYSAALYGYLETQAVAVAKNARYSQIARDDFEDYLFTTDCSNPCRIDHFNFREVLMNGCLAQCGNLDTTVAHSGHYSLKVLSTGSGQVASTRVLKEDSDASGILLTADSSGYYLKPEGCLPKFSPDTGRYFISAWVREPEACNALRYNNAALRVSFTGDTTVTNVLPSGNIIEGWQRIEGTFVVPPSATAITISCIALNSTNVNFDDIRIQPFNSSMKTYVYDWRSQRLMCQLDENNYGTYYEYSDDGTLVRVKKETERGIMTVQETRTVLKRK